MNALLKVASFIGLCLTVVPSILVLAGVISFEVHAYLMLAGTAVWFATAPFWMQNKPPEKQYWKKHRPV